MRTYLSTLHKRSPSHKKRFAFLASGGFTLLIFAVWATVNFGGNPSTSSGQAASVNKSVESANPFGSFLRGIESSFEGLKDSFAGLKEGIESIELESGFEEMRDNTLNTYGQ